MRRALAILVLVAAVSAACTGGASDDPSSTGSTRAGGGASPSGVTEPQASPTPVGTPGTVEVRLLEPPEEGAGEVPTFRWEPVDGASLYRLVVLAGDGTPLWAWEGPATEVTLGGLDVERPEGEGGPVVGPGSAWSVAALDAEGHVIAASVLRPLAP